MRGDDIRDLPLRQRFFPLPRLALAEESLRGLRPLVKAALLLQPGEPREGGVLDRRGERRRARRQSQEARQPREAALGLAEQILELR